MKITKVMLFAGVMLIIAVMLSGCISFKTSKTSEVDTGGGVYKTANKGTVWKQKVAIPTVSGKPANFATANFSSMAMDPGDRRALYFGGAEAGLYYTYDAGDTWQKAGALGNSRIRAIAVDPARKCVVYAAVGNKLVKTDDCGRFWNQKYVDDRKDAAINTIAVDHFDGRIVYLGLASGDLVKSADAGESWQTIHRFGDKIAKALLSPDDSRVIYVITEKKGLFRSGDAGVSWSDINEPVKAAGIGTDINDLVMIEGEPDKLFVSTSRGMIRSGDGGAGWEKIELIPPEKKLAINAFAVSPKNTDEIYYCTNTTFSRSSDGGVTWTPLNLPSSRACAKLLIDPEEPNIIYMGMRAVKK